MPVTALDPLTALLVIDLQSGIHAHPTTEPVDQITRKAGTLAKAFPEPRSARGAGQRRQHPSDPHRSQPVRNQPPDARINDRVRRRPEPTAKRPHHPPLYCGRSRGNAVSGERL